MRLDCVLAVRRRVVAVVGSCVVVGVLAVDVVCVDVCLQGGGPRGVWIRGVVGLFASEVDVASNRAIWVG
jgi:hypothetical protein